MISPSSKWQIQLQNPNYFRIPTEWQTVQKNFQLQKANSKINFKLPTILRFLRNDKLCGKTWNSKLQKSTSKINFKLQTILRCLQHDKLCKKNFQLQKSTSTSKIKLETWNFKKQLQNSNSKLQTPNYFKIPTEWQTVWRNLKLETWYSKLQKSTSNFKLQTSNSQLF